MNNFDKLKSLSTDDLDAAKIAKSLSEHQTIIINFVLIVGSLILVIGMFNTNRAKDQDMHIRISQVQQKLDAIKARDTAIVNLNEFKSSLPQKLNEVELITVISNYAKLGNITISSLTPAESKNLGFYDLINVSFDAESSDFKRMMLFLRKIETSKFPLRVDTWTGHEDEAGKMTFQVNISAVIIHT